MEIVEEEIIIPQSTVSPDVVSSETKGILRTDNLVKKYGKRTVVNHVSINVTQGEIVG